MIIGEFVDGTIEEFVKVGATQGEAEEDKYSSAFKLEGLLSSSLCYHCL
jgi:hypothetical protein